MTPKGDAARMLAAIKGGIDIECRECTHIVGFEDEPLPWCAKYKRAQNQPNQRHWGVDIAAGMIAAKTCPHFQLPD